MSVAARARRPWYREPWVWFLIAIPASAVVMGAIMVVLALRSYDGLVADDYYKRGLEINRSIARDAQAARLGLRASVALDPDAGAATAHVAGDAGFAPPDRVTLRLLHATRAGEDVRVELDHLGAGAYAGTLPPRANADPGRWHVHLETEGWRLVARLSGAAAGTVELYPAE